LQETHRRQDGIHREVVLETRGVAQQTITLLGQQSSTLNSISIDQAEILSLSRNQSSILHETGSLFNTNHHSQMTALENLRSENERIFSRAGEQLSVAESTQDMVRQLQK